MSWLMRLLHAGPREVPEHVQKANDLAETLATATEQAEAAVKDYWAARGERDRALTEEYRQAEARRNPNG